MLQIAELKPDHGDQLDFSQTKFRTLEEWSDTLTSRWGGKIEPDPEHDGDGVLGFKYLKGDEPARIFLVQDPEAGHPGIFDNLRGV